MKISNKIKGIERRSAYRKNKNEFYRLGMSERILNFPDESFDQFISSLDQSDIITYPSRFEYEMLKSKIGSYNGVSSDQVLLFPGSDAAIRNIFELTRLKKCETVTSDPCFPMYDVYSKTHHKKIKKAQYKKDLSLSNEDILSHVNENTSLVALANPNSPIGDWKSKDEISDICKHLRKKGIVFLVDEAYVEFSPGSCAALIHDYDNLIVSRTFSKAAGSAGLRLGYTMCNVGLRENLEKLHFTFPITNIATKFANILMDNSHIVSDYARDTVKERNRLNGKLRLAGYKTVNSHCNWIHFRDKRGSDRPKKILDSFGVEFKANAKIPFDSDRDWIRLTVGPGLIETPYIEEILKKEK